jgi:hypothetical protein
MVLSHEMTIIEDEATLASANSYAARRAFRAWVAADLPQRLRDECLETLGGLAQVHAKLIGNDEYNTPNTIHPTRIVPPRWQYCIFVDHDCLRSVEKGPKDPDMQDPALKILTSCILGFCTATGALHSPSGSSVLRLD